MDVQALDTCGDKPRAGAFNNDSDHFSTAFELTCSLHVILNEQFDCNLLQNVFFGIATEVVFLQRYWAVTFPTYLE